jgi:hypothetical protein
MIFCLALYSGERRHNGGRGITTHYNQSCDTNVLLGVLKIPGSRFGFTKNTQIIGQAIYQAAG